MPIKNPLLGVLTRPQHVSSKAHNNPVSRSSIPFHSTDENFELPPTPLRLPSIMNNPNGIAYCSRAILIALYIVGAVGNGSLRHEVQTLPLWFPIVLGFRQSPLAKWVAMPCFLIWLTLMTFIWLFLLGWAKIISGHFSPIEIAMTLIVGIACAVGITINFRWPTPLTWSKALASAALFGVLQLAALRISFMPYIAQH